MHDLHTASRRIIDFLVAERIGALIIGKNPFWKQEMNMGKKHNQEFVQIPHARFIEMLTYKAEAVGIRVRECKLVCVHGQKLNKRRKERESVASEVS